jgi:hypothetical protein
MEFTAPLVLLCLLNVGKNDEHDHWSIDGDAVGLDSGSFGLENFEVGGYFLAVIEWHGECVDKLFEYIVGFGTVGSTDE